MDRIGPKHHPGVRHFIKQWRKARHLTQEQLAERIAELTGEETDHSRISKLERGKDKLREAMIYAFAEAFAIEPGMLFVHPDVWAKKSDAMKLVEDATPAELAAMRATLEAIRKAS